MRINDQICETLDVIELIIDWKFELFIEFVKFKAG